MCTHQQRVQFQATHTTPKAEECEDLSREMDDASTKTALLLVSGIVLLSPLLGFAIGGAVMGTVWSAFSFFYLCFISIPFMVAATHDARQDARKAHLG